MDVVEDKSWEPSPVPGDADLWPGEKPFTVWGQHKPGSLDTRAFEHDVYWVDVHQVPHRLTEMSDSYLGNVISHLEQNIDLYFAHTLVSAAITMLSDSLVGRISSEVIATSAGAPPLEQLSPAEWLEATPLMRALRQRTE